MRCAVDFDENIPLYDQEIKAWGELQSLTEEPGYRERDIKEVEDQEFFKGFKFAFDSVCNTLDNLAFDGTIKTYQQEEIERFMSGALCEMLFSILDNQEDE